ncbi:MAG: glycerol kinase GlpK [Phycisphaerales bacterium]
MALLLAIDAGTTSCRALLFDERGPVVGSAQRDFTQHYPRPGWVEHDPEEIWTTQRRVIDEAVANAGVSRSDIAGIGIANQRETALLWDRATGEPIANAIVWQDRRTAPMCDRLREAGHEPLIRERTGLVLDAYFSATKLAWLLEHVPGASARAERGELAFGTVDSWLIWKLTRGGVHATDPTNASRTLLFDTARGAWDSSLCELFGIPSAVLPDVVPTSGVVAEVSGCASIEGLPIAGLAGDQQAALMGQGCVRPGMAKNTYGTGCFVLLNTGEQRKTSEHRLLSTVAWDIAGERSYALEGSVFVGGAAVQWLRDGLGIIADSSDIEALAATVPDSGGVVFVPALTGLGAPHWDPDARGAILGLTRGTTAAHIARATIEGIAFQTADLLEAMRADAGVPIYALRADGGASVNDALMQFQADVLQIPVIRPTNTEATAWGAALFAGIAIGVLRPSDPDHAVEVDRFEPRMPPKEAADRLSRWREAVSRCKGWERTAAIG